MSSASTGKTVITGQIKLEDVFGSAAKINIATPAYGSSYAGIYVETFYNLMSSGSKNNCTFSFSAIDYADIVVARNYLISNFYYNLKDCSHILFIDDDMGFDASLVYQMLRLKKDIVGVVAPKRSINLM
jgi:hypothetical protein